MYEPRILLKGPFALDVFALSATGEPWRCDDAYEALVAEAWANRVAAAAERHHTLWDGTHYRLTHLEDLTDGRGILRLGTAAFRHIATYRPLHEEHKARGLAPFHHISTAALLGDRRRALRLRQARDQRRHRFHRRRLSAGRRPAGPRRQFPQGNPRRARIESDRLGPLTGLGVVLSTTSNVLVIAALDTALTRDGVRAAFAHREDDEMAEPVFVPPPGSPPICAP
ncbi:MAG: hypothetical protein WDM81_18545 [Rhizomicrobium sp.]